MLKMTNNDWDEVLKIEYKSNSFKKLVDFINKEYEYGEVYPSKDNILRSLCLTPYNSVKAVILGQDPYHGYGEANGLAFSVNDNVKLPPSLKNIFKELYNDTGIVINKGNLEHWACEGVLLLNTVLTVKKDSPASHKNVGWELFTDTIIRKLNKKKEPIVFILWGNFAKSKKDLISNSDHLIIESSHPSPFSCNRGFFGSKPFSRTNNYLREHGIKEIDWNINNE